MAISFTFKLATPNNLTDYNITIYHHTEVGAVKNLDLLLNDSVRVVSVTEVQQGNVSAPKYYGERGYGLPVKDILVSMAECELGQPQKAF